MPYVNIRVAGNLTREQKAAMCNQVTEAICRTIGKPKDSILIFVDELSHDNIAKSGELLQKPT